ncbi:MAG: hypothetical protein EOO57_14185 [Hymenobacter sp.]|nr:MAG: hypothetical protein EOO57_14185 [Hymenobacter sp.]
MDEIELGLASWLQKIVATEEPLAEIVAFRFGLGEVEEGYTIYLAGSKIYDEADTEWATYPPDFLASEEAVLAESEVGEWKDMLLAALHFLGTALRKAPFATSFLGGDIPVYAGFDDGDLYRIK